MQYFEEFDFTEAKYFLQHRCNIIVPINAYVNETISLANKTMDDMNRGM